MITPKTLTKRGAASLFIVIFTIILLGVITLGFTRLILSESSQSSNNDLSQSAYDSALAGVEDAKVAILKYHDCLSKGYNATSSGSAEAVACAKIIKAMQEGMNNQDCDVVSNVLGRNNGDGEVTIQEGQENGNNMNQAYTCVTIQETLNDFRSTLGGCGDIKKQTKPIRTSDINDIQTLQVKWFSNENNSSNNIKPNQDGKLAPLGNEQHIPLLALQIFQTDVNFTLSELSTSRDGQQTDHAALYLQPVNEGTAGASDNISVAEVAATSDKSSNQPFLVPCSSSKASSNGGFYCSATIEFPKPWDHDGNVNNRNNDTTFLIISLPYGQPEADVSIALKGSGGNTIPFIGSQARVDSTGRANNLYRRVESRIDLVNRGFPYPEFAIQMSNDSGSSINKNIEVISD